MTAGSVLVAGSAHGVIAVDDAAGQRRFHAAGEAPYRRDPNWTPPLPGEEAQIFDPRRNRELDGVSVRRWVLFRGGTPVGRIAAFAPGYRPGIGYFGFFESPEDPGAARALLGAAEQWLVAQGCATAFGPIAVNPRDRIGLLIAGFSRPALIFTPYNPPYYRRLLEAAGWSPTVFLRAYGWRPAFTSPRVHSLAERAARDSSIRIRPLRLDRLREETRIIGRLINETLDDAWHFEPIGDEDADDMARLLRPILDPSVALVAEDAAGPCGVVLGVPDINWLWRRAGGRLWPVGWARLLRWRRHIPQLRIMVLGLARRVQGSGVAARLINQLIRAGVSGGYTLGEMSQVYEDNIRMRSILDRMGFPVVRRYAVFTRRLEG
jgi:GNAT superfamily N-acetyltransferase